MATTTPTIHPGMICTVEEFTRSITDKSIRCLTRGESLGLTVSSSARSTTRYDCAQRAYLPSASAGCDCCRPDFTACGAVCHLAHFGGCLFPDSRSRLVDLTVSQRGIVWRFRHVETARLHIFQQPMDLLIVSDTVNISPL